MPELLNLDAVDTDGAIRESMFQTVNDTRADFLRKGVIGGGSLLVGVGLLSAPSAFGATPSKKNDVAILNYALTLEYLEAAFYNEAVASGALSGATLDFAKIVKDHENAHVAFLKKALGSAAVKKPKFDFKGTTKDQAKFQATSYVLENTGVAAYSGQATLIKQAAVVKAAVSILTVEARHAGWIGAIIGKAPAPTRFDSAKSMKQILAAVKGTGFITG